MKKYLVMMFILLSGMTFGQTSNSFNNVDVRNRLRVMWKASFGGASITEVMNIKGNIWFDGTGNRTIKMGSASPDPGNHLLIMSGYGTPVGTSIAGNIYISAPNTDTPGNTILNCDTAGYNGGFTGIGVMVPQEMLDVAGKVRIYTMLKKYIYDELPVVLWDSADSTLYQIEWDSIREAILPAGSADGQILYWDESTDKAWEINPNFYVYDNGNMQLQYTGSPSFYIDSYGDGSNPFQYYRAALGTLASPSVVLNNDVLGAISFEGYNGAGYNQGTYIQSVSKSTFSGSEGGTAFYLQVTPSGSTTPTTRLLVDSGGDIGLSASAPESGVEVGTSFGRIAYATLITSSLDLASGTNGNFYYYYTDPSGVALNITMPAYASTTHREYCVVNTDGVNSTTIKVQTGEVLNGVTNGTYTLTALKSAYIHNSGITALGWVVLTAQGR